MTEEHNPDDLRFQFKVIEGLADSVRQQTQLFAQVLNDMGDIKASVARLEARDYGEKVIELDSKVKVLMMDKDRRDGANGLIHTILKSPFLGWLVGILTVAGALFSGKVKL